MPVKDLWMPGNRKIILCIDSYEQGVLRGRFLGQPWGSLPFQSLSQLLISLDQLLEEPQSDTIPRRFSPLLAQNIRDPYQNLPIRGTLATFELQILFRQHTSWQGILFWQEQQKQQPFRSVLELVLLLDSALQNQEGRAAG